jgi:tetratricopeptide (TPR) repeat protein
MVLGRHVEGLRSLDRAAELDPDQPVVHAERGMYALHHLGNPRGALDLLDRALAACPGVAGWHMERGLALAALHEHGKAAEAFEKVAEVDPGYPVTRRGYYQWHYADALFRTGREREAVATVEPLLEDRPPDPALLNLAAMLFATARDPGLRDLERAVELGQTAYALAPGDSGCWYGLAVALLRSGRWKESCEVLDKILTEGHGGNVTVWLYLSIVHARLGSPLEAGDWYDRAASRMESATYVDPSLEQLRAEAAALLGLGRNK